MNIATIKDTPRVTGDVIKLLKRTKFLYVDAFIPKDLGIGFFEPVLICCCQMDFLGALYLGESRASTESRLIGWLRSPFMAQCNELYRKHASKIHEGYRDGLVHAYAPKLFQLGTDFPEGHLAIMKSGAVRIVVSVLIDDLIQAIEAYQSALKPQFSPEIRYRHGSFEAFRDAFNEIFA